MKHIRLNQPQMVPTNKGWTDVWEITDEDLTGTVNNTPQTLVMAELAIGDEVSNDVLLEVVENVAGLTTATAEVGVSGATTNFIGASNLLAAGVEYYVPAYSVPMYITTGSAKQLLCTVRGGASEAVSAATAGKFRIWAQISRRVDRDRPTY
jgi:hypothetical protein